MNRRLFLTCTGTAAAYSAYHWVKPRRAYAQASGALDYDIVMGAATGQASTTANCWGQSLNGDDWRNLAAVHDAMRSDIGAKGLDVNFQQSMQSVSSVDPNAIDLQSVTNAIQLYQPAFQLSDMQTLYNRLPKDQTSLTNVLARLQQSGIIALLTEHINRCLLMAQAADDLSNGGGGPTPQTATKNPTRNGVAKPPPGYNCAADGAASLALGLAIAVIAIMAGPAGVLAMAFWEGVILWGGTGAAAWSAGHAIVCNF